MSNDVVLNSNAGTATQADIHYHEPHEHHHHESFITKYI